MVARQREGLVLEVVHDESLVFNNERGEATALNQSAALVFQLCDGSHTIADMTAALEGAGLGESSEDAVWLALGELADAGLIDLEAERPAHVNRRSLLKKVGLSAAALAALPVIETIKAPSVMAQASSTPSPTSAPTPAPTTATSAPTPAPTTATSAPTPAPTTATSAPTPSPTPTSTLV
ncbi:MAG: PqqD family peptide modification chaperone [Ilumatobacter sp.]